MHVTAKGFVDVGGTLWLHVMGVMVMSLAGE